MKFYSSRKCWICYVLWYNCRLQKGFISFLLQKIHFCFTCFPWKFRFSHSFSTDVTEFGHWSKKRNSLCIMTPFLTVDCHWTSLSNSLGAIMLQYCSLHLCDKQVTSPYSTVCSTQQSLTNSPSSWRARWVKLWLHSIPKWLHGRYNGTVICRNHS
jgi:hypothetical protein